MFDFFTEAVKETAEFYSAFHYLNNLSDDELEILGIKRAEILIEIQKSFLKKYGYATN